MLDSCRHWWRLRTLIKSWMEFRDIVSAKLGSPEVSAEEDERFLKVKARVAGLLPHVLVASGAGSLVQESQKQVALMTDLLNRYRTLRHETPPSTRELEEFDRAWHQHFIYLNKLRGATRRREPGGRIGVGAAVPTGMPRHRIRRRVPGLGLLNFVVKLGIFALVLYLLGQAFGVRWDPSGKFVAQPPTTLGGVGDNVAGGFQSIWSGVLHFVGPAVAVYGSSLTIVLVVVLLLAVGYWIFIRG